MFRIARDVTLMINQLSVELLKNFSALSKVFFVTFEAARSPESNFS